MTPVQQLSELLVEHKRRKYPSVPEKAIPKPKISILNTNGLTKVILQTFEVYGLYATRVQSQGQYDPQLRIFRKGNTKRGTADIHAVVNGKHCSIEVKYGADRMSKSQRETEKQVQDSGGVYFVARTFESFWSWFHEIKKGGSHE